MNGQSYRVKDEITIAAPGAMNKIRQIGRFSQDRQDRP